MSAYEKRLQGLRDATAREGSDLYLSLYPPDNQYLTGFTGSMSAVIVTPAEALFLCDPRYTEQARSQVRNFEVEEIRGAFLPKVAERVQLLGVASMATDPATLTVSQAELFQKAFPGGIRYISDAVADLRMVKDPAEIELIRAASDLAESALADIVAMLKPGISEAEVAAHIEFEFKKRGASEASFHTIVLFGERSSLPHGEPSNARLKPGDIILIDMGCRRAGYCSDLTRTFVYGRMPVAWFTEIYQVTAAAQSAALAALRLGIPAHEIDSVARKVIADAGYGDYFGHGLGHGVGIEIHERPRLNSKSDVMLREGMVVTVEPGIYLPGRGGVRIEDMVVLTENGCKFISKYPRELKVLE